MAMIVALETIVVSLAAAEVKRGGPGFVDGLRPSIVEAVKAFGNPIADAFAAEYADDLIEAIKAECQS
jgi:hypothetical protein